MTKYNFSWDLAWLNKVLIRTEYRSPTLNDILLRVAGVTYPKLIDASPEYHNLNLNKRSSYITTFSCLFGRYRCIRLPFGVAPVGNIFQKKIDVIFTMPNVFHISDDILIAGFDKQSKDHGETLNKVLRICRQANLKLNKDDCLFRCTGIPFFGKIIS